MTYSKSNQCDNGFLVAAKPYIERYPVYGKFIDYPVREYPSSQQAKPAKQGEVLYLGNKIMK